MRRFWVCLAPKVQSLLLSTTTFKHCTCFLKTLAKVFKNLVTHRKQFLWSMKWKSLTSEVNCKIRSGISTHTSSSFQKTLCRANCCMHDPFHQHQIHMQEKRVVFGRHSTSSHTSKKPLQSLHLLSNPSAKTH